MKNPLKEKQAKDEQGQYLVSDGRGRLEWVTKDGVKFTCPVKWTGGPVKDDES